MNTDPLAFFREDFVALFNRGSKALADRAASGDASDKARYDDIAAARGAVRLVFEGDDGGEVWLAIENGAMEARDGSPDLPPRLAIAVPADAARAALEMIADEDRLDEDRASRRIARSASAEVEKILAGHRLEFHVTITDLPADPEQVTVRIAVGATDAPDEPKFSAKVSWDDIEDVRAGEMTPQQLFGRLKITGDATQAMALGMTLMQRKR
ncbi:MAG: SCP2 sterol-binding domain-containing protein [Sandaracinaceae bacterium]